MSRLSSSNFTGIYRQWLPIVRRWVRLLGTPESDSDDLVQEIFIVVYRRLVAFDGQNLAGWLYKITRRRVRDYKRLAWVRRARRITDVASVTHLPADRDPEHEFEKLESVRIFAELLATIGGEQRRAFVLFELEGLAGQEIAQLQNVSINTVWARIHRARKRLQAEARAREQGST